MLPEDPAVWVIGGENHSPLYASLKKSPQAKGEHITLPIKSGKTTYRLEYTKLIGFKKQVLKISNQDQSRRSIFVFLAELDSKKQGALSRLKQLVALVKELAGLGFVVVVLISALTLDDAWGFVTTIKKLNGHAFTLQSGGKEVPPELRPVRRTSKHVLSAIADAVEAHRGSPPETDDRKKERLALDLKEQRLVDDALNTLDSEKDEYRHAEKGPGVYSRFMSSVSSMFGSRYAKKSINLKASEEVDDIESTLERASLPNEVEQLEQLPGELKKVDLAFNTALRRKPKPPKSRKHKKKKVKSKIERDSKISASSAATVTTAATTVTTEAAATTTKDYSEEFFGGLQDDTERNEQLDRDLLDMRQIQRQRRESGRRQQEEKQRQSQQQQQQLQQQQQQESKEGDAKEQQVQWEYANVQLLRKEVQHVLRPTQYVLRPTQRLLLSDDESTPIEDSLVEKEPSAPGGRAKVVVEKVLTDREDHLFARDGRDTKKNLFPVPPAASPASRPGSSGTESPTFVPPTLDLGRSRRGRSGGGLWRAAGGGRLWITFP